MIENGFLYCKICDEAYKSAKIKHRQQMMKISETDEIKQEYAFCRKCKTTYNLLIKDNKVLNMTEASDKS